MKAENQAFSQDRRVRKRREYNALQKGRRIATAHCVFLLRERGDEAPARLGLIVSRKVGNAVVRNAFKRRCRELFRCRFGAELPGWDVAVLAKPTAGALGHDEIAKQWTQALSRLRR